MSDLYELLAQAWVSQESDSGPARPPLANDGITRAYLDRLASLSLESLSTTEPASLTHTAQSHARNLKALSKRSHKAVIASSTHLSTLSSILPSLSEQAKELKTNLPHFESAATAFATKYDRSTENAVLDRRKRAMLLSRNIDRTSDILELPSLLSSTVSAAQQSSSTASTSSTPYTLALDLHAHIKRLDALYPKSGLVDSIFRQAEGEMRNLTTALIVSLQSPSLKLAAAMRTIGHLRRVAPDLAGDGRSINKATATSAKSIGLLSSSINNDGALGALFLTCRLHSMHRTLEALEPLRELADQETTSRRYQGQSNGKSLTQSAITMGSQSERYLKRWIEMFREQSFGIVSMYKSIFPTGLPSPEQAPGDASLSNLQAGANSGPLLPLPSPVSTFAMHLVDMVTTTLREYMPNISDKSSRESLLTQTLYCAGSLGRLGADFGMELALLEEELDEGREDDEEEDDEKDLDPPEWVQVMKKHRTQASRLEVLARGVGTGRKASMDVQTPTALPAG